MKITPLESWISRRIGIGDCRLTRGVIERYQLEKLRETLAWARMRSPFYKELLGAVPVQALTDLRQISRLPFTISRDISRNPLRFLCLSQDGFRRVVTLHSSGTSGSPKRIYFTDEDLEATVDFFHHGMSTLAGPGDRVLILFPGDRTGSIGDLLKEGLDRLSATGVRHGIVRDAFGTLEVMSECRTTCVVGMPTQVLALARLGGKTAAPRSVLLSADHVPDALSEALRSAWGCEVYSHYGMTEMGYGGGIECEAHRGYHLREADFYFEIVDPESGDPLPDGKKGEIVFTTLTRKGMPLIRYRTGDLGRFIPGTCECGTALRTLAPVKERVEGLIALVPGMTLGLADLDEALFGIDGIIDFDAVISHGSRNDCLTIKAGVVRIEEEGVRHAIRQALESLDVIRRLTGERRLAVSVEVVACDGPLGNRKRTIVDKRGTLSTDEYLQPDSGFAG